MRQKSSFCIELSNTIAVSKNFSVDSKENFKFKKAVRYEKRKIGVENRQRHKGRFVKQIKPM